jgi:trimeric autotransporter adhesin
MKAKILLLIPVMLVFIALTAVAQRVTPQRHSVKDIIPFGKKLPPPDFTKSWGKPTPGFTNPGINNALTKSRNLPDPNTIKKDPESYRQQLLNTRKLQRLSLSSNAAGPAANAESERSGRPDFHLTRDINALAESNPVNNQFAYPSADSYAVLDNVIYFAADDGIHGNELWRSDGTAVGTFMLKDIEPGPGSAFLRHITAANGKLYFSAANAAYGLEPWVSDGTESGTQLLIDLQPGPTWGFSKEFVEVGNDVYFIADGFNIYWDAIWKTDGTTGGTVLVKDIGAAGGGIDIIAAMAANGLLFFTMYDFTYGYELWRSDGTDAGTFLIKDIGPFEYSSLPTQLTSYNNQLYFSADDGTGRKLWVTDGTDAGTNYAPGNNDILIDADYFGLKFPVLNNVLFIPGSSPATGNGLFKYDANNASGVVLVRDLTTGAEPDLIVASEMVTVNNRIYFKAINSNSGVHDELWTSRGNSFDTWMVKKFPTGETTSLLSNGSGTLYYAKSDAVYGSELWKVSGVPLETTLVSDIFKGPTSSFPSFLTAFKGKLFFSAADEATGNELFMTDGTDNGTALVKDINTSATTGSFPAGLVALGHNVLFNAYERVHGTELYRSDGTAQGTQLLNDVEPGEADVFNFGSLSKNNAAYFIGYTPSTGNACIYKTNSKKTGLSKMIPDFSTYQYGVPTIQVADNGILFYSIYNAYAGTVELWSSDGTDKGHYLLSSTLYVYDYLNVAGNTAFFVAGDEVNGYELWKSDGSPEGTMIVKDINPGLDDGAPGGMFAYKNEVYFGAFDGTSFNYSFWKSDGTEEGTIKLAEIDPLWGFDAASTGQLFCISNNILYFSATNYSDGKGNTLWKTDGTVAGTKPIKDINPYSDDPTIGPYYLTDVNGTVFFIVDDGEHGDELWKTKGTKKSTKLVKDITPGIDPTFTGSLTSFSGKLFFAKFTDYAFFLWSSNGREKGTKVVDDDGISNVEISSIISGGKKLFIGGYTHEFGSELYAGKVEDDKETFARAAVSEVTVKETGAFKAELYPNPASTKASVQISGKAKDVYISITDVSGKKLWQSQNSNASVINLPVEKMAPGIYLVTVISGKETKIIKLVKQ